MRHNNKSSFCNSHRIHDDPLEEHFYITKKIYVSKYCYHYSLIKVFWTFTSLNLVLL